MYQFNNNNISINDIASYLNNVSIFQKDYEINNPSTVDEISDYSVTYIDKISIDELKKINKKSLVLTKYIDESILKKLNIIPDIIITDDPYRDFYLIVKEFFIEDEVFSIHPAVKIDNSTTIGINVNIEEGSSIGKNVFIGNNTYIGKNVIINDNVVIGNNCYLKDGSILSSDGFNFIDENSGFSYIPFFGKLIIGNNVWIGSKSIIERPSIGTVRIQHHVKIDDLVQIGSDSHIGEKTQIAAGSIIGRGVSIGANCSFGINTLLKPNITIPKRVITGVGAVVITNLEENSTYVGNPAKKLVKSVG